jgi:hypothetical protein
MSTFAHRTGSDVDENAFWQMPSAPMLTITEEPLVLLLTSAQNTPSFVPSFVVPLLSVPTLHACPEAANAGIDGASTAVADAATATRRRARTLLGRFGEVSGR